MNHLTHPRKALPSLKSIALTAAIGTAIFIGAGPPARAALIGQWVAGAPNLNDTSGFKPAGTHDGVAVGTTANLAYSADVPAGYTGQSLDLKGNVGVMINNTVLTDAAYQTTYDLPTRDQFTIAFWAKGFPGTWSPWVCKGGEGSIGWQLRRFGGDPISCFTIRGIDNADGGGSPINVNDNPAKWHHFAGVWNKATGTRTLYVDGVFSHVVTNNVSQTMSLAYDKHLTLGMREKGDNTGYEAYFLGKLFDVRIYNTPLTQNEVRGLLPPPVPVDLLATPSSTRIGLEWAPVSGATSYTVWTQNTLTLAEQTGTTTEPRFSITGLTNGTPYTFKVKATNSIGSSAYSEEASGTPIPGMSSSKDLLTFAFNGFANITITGTNITQYMPAGTDVTALAPTYTTSFFYATGNPVSGTPRDFTYPQTYTITAEDGSSKNYTVAVSLVTPLTYDFSGSLQGWTQLWPTAPGVLLENNALGSGYDDGDTRFARSPAFYLLDSGPLSFYLDGGQSEQASVGFSPAEIPELAIQDNGFAGVALRDVADNVYVLSRRKAGDGGGFQKFQFTAAELAPFANDGRQYTLDYIDYNKGGWGWTYMDNVSIPGVLMQPGTEALITSIKVGPLSSSQITGTDITVWLPYGTSVNALTPLIAVSPGATLSPPSGTVFDFSTPQTFTVTSGDTLATNEYTVTVVAAGSLNVKTYDSTYGDYNLAPISVLQAVTPSASTTTVDNVSYGNFVGGLPGLTDANTFAVLWEGWFDVTKEGPGIYTFGTQSDDGSMLYLDLNDDGDFDDAGELIVNNNGLHGYDIRTGSVNLPMDTVRCAIGYFEDGGGDGMEARFKKGKDLAFASLDLIGGRSGHFRATRPAAIPTSAVLWSLTYGGQIAKANGNQLLLVVPIGSNLAALDPTFTLSPGATSVPPSGTMRDFTTPQTYTVTSQDLSATAAYTVTARIGGSLNVSTYDNTYGASYLVPLSNLLSTVPSATAIQTADINYGNFVAGLPGLTGADTFAVLWDGWLDVSEEGPGDYTFGITSDDGCVIYLDLNNDGDFDDIGELLLNNSVHSGATPILRTVFLPMDSVRFAIGFYEDGGGEAMVARMKKGSGFAFGDMDLIGGSSGLHFATQPPANPASAALWYLTSGDDVAKATGPTELVLSVPVGTDLTTLDPTFMLSPGATSVPPSGTARNFTTPQTYEVKSQDNSTTTTYTVRAYQSLRYDFNNATLQGWHNRVWDLSANSGSGGWIELAPNASTFPATVNGGVSQPPSVDNGLFGAANGAAWPNGNQDVHLNTLWLQSPAFYLDAVADLTVELSRGANNNAVDPTAEVDIPFAALLNNNGVAPGGWKGVVLRRVSDGAFLLVKPRTGASGDEVRTVTFTAEELAPFDGVACTLDLINTDSGGWGWIVMDNVLIPATGLVPVSPFDSWRAAYPDLVGAMGLPGADPDADGFSNLEEFAFGTNPMIADFAVIAFTEGSVTAHGQPTLGTASGYSAIFGRRLDRIAAGLTYTVEFSENLSDWVPNAGEPTVLATDLTIEAVEVAFPATINTPGGLKVPKFFRLKVTQN